MNCADDMKNLQAAVTADFVDFLAELDDTYDKVYSDILRCDKVPSIKNVFLMDIQTQEIFGRGTKKGGLYYVDDVATSRVLRACSAETSYHRRI
ncbi:hypothetical protein L3X38_025953 [Prunus dulcis]|uniref:Uncharacterized protein n=1 Tax=Prunus dulcis TaxID=3755 RepID=A0AAD4W2Q5_PRUDU|nr:hypothetical protein L3X38_025953 [Prunus dulcis]